MTEEASKTSRTKTRNGYAISQALRHQIERVAFELRLSDQARTYLWNAIDLGPSRQVQGRCGNVVINFHSRKIQGRLQLESRRGEFTKAVLLEQDPDVLAYFAQPPEITLNIDTADGRRATTNRYTPDFLVIRKDGIVVQETRDGERLLKAHLHNPHQFFQDEHSTWHYRAAEAHFATMGLGFELTANNQLPALLAENTRFLEDYLREDCPELSPEQTETLRQTVLKRRYISLGELVDLGFTADVVYQAIARQVVYVDLKSDRLSATHELLVFSDQETHQACALIRCEALRSAPLPIPGTLHLKCNAKLRFDGKTYTVLVVGDRDVLMQSEDGQQFVRSTASLMLAHKAKLIEGDAFVNEPANASLASCSPAELKRATEKLSALEAGTSDTYSDRSLRRFRLATEHLTDPARKVLALVGLTRQRGNRKTRISEAHREAIERVIKTRHNTPQGRTKYGTWHKYVAECREIFEDSGAAIEPVSYATFCRYVAEMESIKERKGRRAAYQVDPIIQALDSQFPVHGVRPFEILCIDHTILNLATRSPHGIDLGKPTFTLAIDPHTTKPMAMILSYDPPSSKTVLMILRDYVRRHGRLPRILGVDNGKEFHSRELEAFCAMYGIDLRFRSPGMPRGGSMVERALGVTEDEFVSELEGNTRILKADARTVTKSVDPFRRAVWTLLATYKALEQHLFHERAGRIHPALGMSPNEFEAKRLAETGARDFVGIHFDENLMLMTSPRPRVGLHKVSRKGVWVNYTWFTHPELRTLREGTKVEIRIEPWNASVVYVQVGHRWVAAVGVNSRWLVNRTVREVEIALARERGQAATKAQKSRLSVDKHSSRERVLIPQDFDERLALQQSEMRYVYEGLNMTHALPEAAPKHIDEGASNDSETARLSTADKVFPGSAPASPRPKPESGADQGGDESLDAEPEVRVGSPVSTGATKVRKPRPAKRTQALDVEDIEPLNAPSTASNDEVIGQPAMAQHMRSTGFFR